MRLFLALLRRDLALAGRQGGESGLALLFFVLGAALFPLGLGPEPGILAGVGSGLLWVIALLAVLLSLERLFRADWEDGTLDLLAARPEPLAAVVLAKCAAHWLATGLPMAVIAPLLGSMLAVPGERLGLLALSFLAGTPALTLVGAAGAALTLGARLGGVLTAILVLPLYIPVLIFGAAAAEGREGALALLAAMSLGALALAPAAAAAALRHAVEQ